MSTMKTPAVILEGVWCQSRYSHCRMFCPRSIHSWWREIWLERVRTKELMAVLRVTIHVGFCQQSASYNSNSDL